MSKVQRWVLIGGLLLVFLAGLFPPLTLVVVREGDNYYFPQHKRAFLPWPARLRGLASGKTGVHIWVFRGHNTQLFTRGKG